MLSHFPGCQHKVESTVPASRELLQMKAVEVTSGCCSAFKLHLLQKKSSVIIGSSSDLSSLGEEITYLYYVIQPSALWSLTRKGERTHLCFVEWTECKHVKLCYDSFLSWGLQKAEKGKIQRKREKWVRHADNPQSMYPQGSL